MDLASLFAAGAGSRELSDRELRQLGMDGCARLTAVELEDLLLRCTGLGLADMSDSAFHGLVYLADFDAYYAPAGDAGYVRFQYGCHNPDGTVTLRSSATGRWLPAHAEYPKRGGVIMSTSASSSSGSSRAGAGLSATIVLF